MKKYKDEFKMNKSRKNKKALELGATMLCLPEVMKDGQNGTGLSKKEKKVFQQNLKECEKIKYDCDLKDYLEYSGARPCSNA